MGDRTFRKDKEVFDIRASRRKLQEVGSQFVSSAVATMGAAKKMDVSVDQAIVDAPSGGVAPPRTGFVYVARPMCRQGARIAAEFSFLGKSPLNCGTRFLQAAKSYAIEKPEVPGMHLPSGTARTCRGSPADGTGRATLPATRPGTRACCTCASGPSGWTFVRRTPRAAAAPTWQC